MKKYLIIFFILCFISPAFAKEKVIYNDTEYELSLARESKNKVRKKYYKKVGTEYLAKKQKLKDDLKGWEEVDA